MKGTNLKMKKIIKNIIKILKKDQHEEINNKKKMIENILETKNYEQMKSLDASDLMDCLINLNYDYFNKMPFETLNHEQKVVFLCMTLEDVCQADTILSLEEDGLMLQMPQIHDALLEIGAFNTALFVKEFIDLLPENTFKELKLPEWSWFFEDVERKQKIENIDSEISNYPDGSMKIIYQKYIAKENVAKKILEIN
jgi:hypothetical protein